MRMLRWVLIGAVGLLALAVVGVAWVINTEAGTRQAMAYATAVMSGKLQVSAVEGTIAGPLTLTDLRYHDRNAGIAVRAQRIVVDAALMDLTRAVVHVRSVDLSGIDVLLQEPAQPPPEEEEKPFTLDPPIDIVIDSLTVSDTKIRRDADVLLDITTARLGARWTGAGLGIEQFELVSPQGEAHFVGRVAQQEAFVGTGAGRFRWSVGEKTYAGTLNAVAERKDVKAAVKLTRPLHADLDVFLQQTEAFPWRFTLEAPRFDPRDELLPDSKLQNLAASLSGEGTMKAGSIKGELLIDGESVFLDPLRYARNERGLAIDSVLRLGEASGVLRADGTIDLDAEPLSANVKATWRDVVIPAQWAGQELHSRGDLHVHGNAETFAAKGALAIGPQNRIADIALDIEGSPAAVQIAQFAIVQKAGRLDATGKVDLQPAVAWNLNATAQRFDPGAFAVEWPGKLDFELTSNGRMTEEGPAGSVQLPQLAGELRGRKLSGTADLALTPPLSVAGDLSLRSGQSEIEFKGQRGESMDAVLSFDIVSLGDWVPDGRGKLSGRFTVQGRWPKLAIAGEARGRELNAAETTIESLTLVADINEPLNPRGSAQIDIATLTTAGLNFASIRARASGAPDAHDLELRATGEPLSLELAVNGGRKGAGWSASVQRLIIDMKDAARLALREPVQVALADGSIDVSQACLADGDIELCVRGNTQRDGALQASYSLAGVPLALANTFASSGWPLQFTGVIEGRGDIRRTPAGELFGEASIRSPSGSISQRAPEGEIDEAAAPPPTLLSYRDFNAEAKLSGPDVRGSVRAQLNEGGSIEGAGTLQGLNQPNTNIAARFAASIPDLAPFGIFAPQLANLRGRVDAQGTAAGALQKPQIAGQVLVADLAADIPAIGLHLKNGQLRAQPTSSGDITIDGSVTSGEGTIAIAGTASPAGNVNAKINGDRFLAADIPGAHVVITPALQVERADGRTTLSGEVTIPQAAINLQKLPRGGDKAQAASSDVVVIDAVTRAEEAKQAPLFADITVILGERVELTGFGLQAQVQGRLDVRERPGTPTVGSGEVRVAGTYKAYGQDLTIKEGRLLYAGTPLDNPRLNIEATREVDEVTAGLRITGSAQSPELSVFSDPMMAQADALSYLVAGKPINEIGADDGEGDALQSATRSLSAAAGGLLAKNVGRRLGVDELAVKDDEMIGGSALTIGQYLSPRLFLSYGVGLFEPGEVVTLRYDLTRDFALKAQRGSEDTRAGVEYRLEK